MGERKLKRGARGGQLEEVEEKAGRGGRVGKEETSGPEEGGKHGEDCEEGGKGRAEGQAKGGR